jgi:hypothetical protein
MKNHYDNSERLEGVSDKEWREALDQVTAYLRWRLAGKTQRGAHSEQALGMPALDYYQEEAVIKLIEGEWKWQDRFSLGKQLEKIAADLVTKQVERWKRSHGITELGKYGTTDDTDFTDEARVRRKVPEFIELREPERLPDVADPSTGSGTEKEMLDETYEMVYGLVADDEELTIL